MATAIYSYLQHWQKAQNIDLDDFMEILTFFLWGPTEIIDKLTLKSLILQKREIKFKLYPEFWIWWEHKLG